MILKPVFAIFITGFLLCTFPVVKAGGQTVVTGRVTAEVVESVSASPQSITGPNMTNGIIDTKYKLNDKDSSNSETVDLGTIKVNSRTMLACNLVIQSVKLTDGKGKDFTLDSSFTTPGQSDQGSIDTTKTIQIKRTALLSFGQESGQYEGTYTMVFAYN